MPSPPGGRGSRPRARSPGTARPATFDRPSASIRYSERSNRRNCPLFISGTRTVPKERSRDPRFRGRGPQVPDVHVGDVEAPRPRPPHRLVDRAPGRAPSHHRKPGTRLARVEPLLGDARRDAVDLRRPDVRHALVVVRVIGDVAAVVTLLDPAHPVLEPRRARTHPGASEGVGVAEVRVEALRVGPERGREGLVAGDVRDPPRLRGVGEVGVRSAR